MVLLAGLCLQSQLYGLGSRRGSGDHYHCLSVFTEYLAHGFTTLPEFLGYVLIRECVWLS